MPLMDINFGALPDTWMESELFGHEKGAFTGATQQRKGMLEMADGGNGFLDEIGDLSLPLQAKLLRVLQDRQFHRMAGSQTVWLMFALSRLRTRIFAGGESGAVPRRPLLSTQSCDLDAAYASRTIRTISRSSLSSFWIDI